MHAANYCPPASTSPRPDPATLFCTEPSICCV